MRRHTRQPDPTPVDNRGENLLEGPELLGDRGLEVELKLDLGNDRAHVLPVLSGSNMGAPGKLPVLGYVRPELPPSDLTASDMSESGPVLGFDAGLLAEPLGDGLLTDRRPLQKLRKTRRKSGLTASNLDRSLECGNVRFIHNARAYTTRVVEVNDKGCVPPHNNGCTVLYMPDRKVKSAAAPVTRNPAPRIREAELGPDGNTLGDRLKLAMTNYARSHGRGNFEGYSQTEWVEMATRAVGKDPEKVLVMTQQNLSLILNNKSSGPDGVIAFAVLLGVEAAWLQYGIGPPTYIDKQLSAGRR